MSFVKPFETTAVKKDGVVRFRHAGEYKSWCERLREGQEVMVVFEPAKATRSVLANSLYWAGYINPVAEYTGYSPNQIHALFKKMFLPKQRIEIVDKQTGVVVQEAELEQLTTTTLTNTEFSNYLHDIEEWVVDTFHGTVKVGSNREAA